MSLNDTLDYISLRVSVSGVAGALAGSAISLYRGYDSIVRTSSRTALSCALVGTACFTMERLVNVGVNMYLNGKDGDFDARDSCKRQYYVKLYSHTIGGLIGGAWVGGLFTGKFMRGALVFAPIMLAIAMTEEKIAELRQEEQVTEIHYEPKQTTSQGDSTKFGGI
jgi:hypothetical protein